jgi:photosystem II stability/assembly factor-like uncharacterized protein
MRSTGCRTAQATAGTDRFRMHLEGLGDRRRSGRRSRAARLVALSLFVMGGVLPAIGFGVATAATYNSWSAQSSGTTQTLYGISFVDANNGWTVGGGGVVRHTANGGVTWTGQTSGVTSTLYGVAFTDASTGWVVGSSGVIRHTSDGGATWTAQTSGVTSTLYAVSFLDANNGYAVGSSGVVRHTTNGGSTWSSQASGTTSTLYGVAFAGANNGWVVGSSGVVRHTTNGGSTWSSQSSGSNRTLYAVSFLDANNGWLVGSRGVLKHTTNGGSTWSTQTSGTGGTIYDVAFADANNGWLIASSGVIRRTTNGGTAWTTQPTGSSATLRGLANTAGGLWSCGSGGVVLTYLIDTAAPVTAATGLQATSSGPWLSGSQTVTLSATDGQSGVAATYYTIDGGTRQTYAGQFTVSTQGSHTVVYWSVDGAGNTEANHSGYLRIDSSAPTTSAGSLAIDNHSGWRTSSQTVTLTATDASSGVAVTSYILDGGTQQIYGSPILIAGSGSHSLTFWSSDVAGNVEPSHTGYVNIDTTAPATSATGVQPSVGSGWQNVSQTVSLAPNDPLSGVASTYFTFDGGTLQTYSAPFTVSAQGSHTIVYWSVDAVGNTEGSHTGYVNVDTTAPTAGDDADGNWHNSDVVVHLSPADGGGSGLAAVQYRLQGSATWLAAAGNAFTVPAPAGGSGDGAHVYQYRAVDNAGNSSPVASCTLWIDTVAPQTTGTGLQPDELSGWRTTSQTVGLSADDGTGSGVAGLTYTLDGGTAQVYTSPFVVSGLGQHRVVFHAVDAAGNAEPSQTGWVNISNPFAQATGLADSPSTGWRSTGTTVAVSGSGDHQPLTMHYRFDLGGWQTAGNPAGIPVNGEGSHRIDYYARNTVGLESVHETGYLNVDNSAPSTSATGLQADDHSGWNAAGLSVSLTASDSLSGVAATFYTVDGGTVQAWLGTPFLVSGAGSHSVIYWSADAAGNVETSHTGYVNVDGAGPTCSATGLATDGHSGWSTGSQTVTLAAADAQSGVVAIYYTIDGGSTTTYSGPFLVTAQGSHTIAYWSVDRVGNTSTPTSGFVNIDSGAPTTSAVGLQSDDHSGWRTTAGTVSLSAGDGSGSGVASTYYTIDGGSRQTYGAPFTVSASGSHTIAYWSVDTAGNAETTTTGYVNIDTTAPATTAVGLQPNDHSGWATTTQTVTFTGTDALSGVGAIRYTVDGGSTQTYSASFPVAGERSHVLTYWSVDAAGNVEATHVAYVNIDATAPVTSATGLQADDHSGWQNTSQLVNLAAGDGAGSGVSAVWYRLDAGSQQTYSTPFAISGQGTHTISYGAVDAAGNAEPSHTGYVNIDTTVPTVADDADSAWHKTAVTVHLAPADTGGSSVAGTQYRLLGSTAWTDATANAFVVPAPSDGSGDGSHQYQYRALDGAGNVSAIATCTVRIDTQGPVVTPTGLQTDSLSGWTNGNQTVSLPAADAGSGVATTYYTVDSGTTQTYGVPFMVTGQGQHPVVYWAADPLGNESVHKTGWVNISNPFAQVTGLAADNRSSWRNSAATVTITGSGDHTPIRIYYRLDSGSWLNVASPASIPVSGQGSHTVSYYSVNSVAVESVHETGYVNIDLTAPVTTASGLQADNHSGWTTSSQSVSFSATDAQAGVSSTTYSVDGGTSQAYTGTPVVISGNGSHVVTYWSADSAGNIEAMKTGYVNIDTAAPTTTATGLAADDHSGWSTSGQTVALTATDGTGSGATATYYTVDGGDQTTYTGAFALTDEGQHQVTYWSVDAMGNAEAARTGYVNVDVTPPVTTATGLKTDALSGWSNGAQTVTLTADDDVGSGVTATYYTVDGGARQTYAAPFSISAAGSHAILYWSVDAIGNTEPSNTGYVNIDMGTPTVGDDAPATWGNIAVTVHLAVADTGGSGLASVEYRLQGSTTWASAAGNAFSVAAPADHSGDGAHVYQYRATDVAGNVSSLGACTVRIDTKVPATSAGGLQADNHFGWRSNAQTVSLSATDEHSGLAATYYILDGGGRQTYAAPFAVTAQGSHAIAYWSTDTAGNTEASHTGYVNIDTTAPTVGNDADSAWHNSAVTVHLSPADTGGSGLAGTQYRLQGAATWLTATGDAFVAPAPGDGSGDGALVYEYRALDGAGNQSATGSCTVRIDTQAPVTTAGGLQPNNHTGWRTAAQTVALTPNDGAGSGPAATYYTLDGGARQTYSAPFTVSAAGRHRVTYWSTDSLGNVESPHVGYVNIDTSAPVTSAIGLAADDHSGWENTPQLVSLDASDGLSGVATTVYTLDGGSQQTYGGPFTISTDGKHTIAYWSVDAVGNTETALTGYVNIDTSAPVTTPAGLAPDQHSGWRTTAQTVSLSADDGTGSGVLSITYSLDGFAAQTYMGSFGISTIGQHPVTYFATDAAGNTEVVRTGWVNISNPFAQAAAGLSADDHSAWHTAATTVSIAAGGDQGPLSVLYQVDGGPLQTIASPASITLSTEGAHRVDYYARNAVGVESVHQTGYVNIDTTPPVTAATDLQADNDSGWVSSSQLVSLAASDAISGLHRTYYTVDGGAQQTYSAGTPVQVCGNGSHAVTYWSVDAAGNTEAVHTGYVNIDATGPAIRSDATNAWHNVPVAVDLTASDGDSGVASTEYRLQGSTTWLPAPGNLFLVPAPADGSWDGVHVYEYHALDNAGNVGPTGTATVKIDTTAPGVTADADAYWHNSAITVHISGADAASGIGQLSYRLQGASSWTTVAGAAADAAVAAPTDGQPHSYTYQYQASDAAGNLSAIATFTVHMDTRIPNTAVSGLPATPWVNRPVTLAFTATPGDGAAIARIEYSTNGGASWTPIAAGAPLLISAPGQTAVLYRSVNAAGTVENPARSATVGIDTGKPISLALKNVTAKVKKIAKLTFLIRDAAPSCGSAKVTIAIYLKKKVVKRITIASAATNKNVTCAYKVKLKRGKYTWKVSATDIAGNVQAKIGSKTLTVK